MAQQTINIGSAPDDGTGDTLRVGGDKINDNFTELYADKLDKAGGTLTGDLIVPDEAYDATAWNGNLEVPTKNALRDKLESLGSAAISDAAYDGTWNGDTTTAPSKNAVYDKIEAILAAGGYDDEAARDAIGAALVGGNRITVTPNDGSDTITIAVTSRGALVKKSADQTAANYVGGGSGAVVSWDSETGGYDTDTIHDNSTNPSRLTVPSGVSKVRLSAQVFTSSSTSDTWKIVRIEKNGAYPYFGAGEGRVEIGAASTSARAETAILPVSPGDYFEVRFFEESDTSVTIEEEYSWFAMEIIE